VVLSLLLPTTFFETQASIGWSQLQKMAYVDILFLLAAYFIGPIYAAGGDCMGSGTIECFECNSWEDPRCHDPFNYTAHKHHMPPVRECEGCCVKMVQFIGTEHYQIKRTCTDDFDVNFFMVNHACMTEGHRHGHMCFCEEDECNTASSNLLQQPLTTLGIPLALTLLLGAFPRWLLNTKLCLLYTVWIRKKIIHVSSNRRPNSIVLYYNILKSKTNECAMLIDLVSNFFSKKSS